MPHGDPNVIISVRLRRPLFRRLEALAARDHIGNRSRALEDVLEQGFRVLGLEDPVYLPNPKEK